MTESSTTSPIERAVAAGRRRPTIDLQELLRYRDLLYFLTRRHVLARYKQTILGIAWAVIQPVVTMVVFTVLLHELAGVESKGTPYAVFAYQGILLWGYFAACVGRGAGSIAGNAHLIQVVYFPRIVIPLSNSLAALLDYAIALLVLFALMLAYGQVPALTIFLLVPLLAVTGLIGTGIGMGLAALNVRYRDVSHAIPFLIQVWMFVTPVVYPIDLIPERLRLLYALNPATGLVEAHRSAVQGTPLDLAVLGISLATGLLLAWLGVRFFAKTEREFADVV